MSRLPSFDSDRQRKPQLGALRCGQCSRSSHGNSSKALDRVFLLDRESEHGSSGIQVPRLEQTFANPASLAKPGFCLERQRQSLRETYRLRSRWPPNRQRSAGYSLSLMDAVENVGPKPTDLEGALAAF